jgi:2-phosphosulfolactate phosphatase
MNASHHLSPDVFEQHGFTVRLDWGRRGARAAAGRGDVLVIVDVLSFSTAVATGIERGAMVRPCADQEEARRVARESACEAAVHRLRAPEEGRFSLSPVSFLAADAESRVALASPNGATCSRHAGSAPHLMAGALVNASAVGTAVTELVAQSGLDVTVIACGERWTTPCEDGEIRFAIEDYLGAGAIIAAIDAPKSPEALLCEAAFNGVRASLDGIIRESASGRELRAKGFAGDVEIASQLDLYTSVPSMRGEWFGRWR